MIATLVAPTHGLERTGRSPRTGPFKRDQLLLTDHLEPSLAGGGVMAEPDAASSPFRSQLLKLKGGAIWYPLQSGLAMPLGAIGSSCSRGLMRTIPARSNVFLGTHARHGGTSCCRGCNPVRGGRHIVCIAASSDGQCSESSLFECLAGHMSAGGAFQGLGTQVRGTSALRRLFDTHSPTCR